MVLMLFFLVCQTLVAQDASLLPQNFKELAAAKTDSAKVEAYRDLCFNYSFANTDSGIYFGNKGLEIALRINFIKGIGDCYNSLGWCYNKKGDYGKAKENLQRAIEYFERTRSKCFVSVAHTNMGNVFYNQNLYADALDYYLKSRNESEGCPDVGFKASGIYSIGTIYNAQKEYEKAIGFFKEAADINIANNDTNKLADCINGTGNAYLGLKMADSALIYFRQSSAIYQAQGNINGVAFAAESMGSVYVEKADYKKALESFEFAKTNFELLGSKADVCYELTMIGDAYKQKGEINSAIYYQQWALHMADSNKFSAIQLESLNALSELYALKKDYKSAYDYFKRASSIKDSIAETKQQVKLDELKTKFETEQKDKKIELLNKDKLLEQANAAKQRQLKNIFIAGAIMLLLIAAVLYNRYSLKRKVALELEKKNEIIKLEKERAEKSEQFKQQFLANMSHEIRTPLNAISGMTELLQDAAFDEQYKKYLQVIKNSSENLLAVINDILDLSKIEAGKMELEKIPFNLHELVDHVYQSFAFRAKEKGIELEVEVNKDIPANVIADPMRLTQVLINLTGNAVKFTDKGFVRLSVSLSNAERIASPVSLTEVRFEVSDTGIGIPPEQQSKVFESFRQSHAGTTRKYGGTGLGLTISQNLVELMGGKIEMVSEENKGSVFSFSIPVQVPDVISVGHAKQQPVKEFAKAAPSKILLVEDNEYNRLLVNDALHKKMPAANLVMAASGKEAIDIMQREKFDLVLLDISMPEMDGYEVAEIIRHKLSDEVKHIPIIAITANVSQAEMEKCKAAGMNDFMAKPFRISDLVATVSKYIPAEYTHEIKEFKSETHTQGSVIDLSYLNNFTEGDEDEIKKYVQIFLHRIPVALNEIEMAFRQNSEKQVVSILHGIKPLLVSVGLNDCEKIISEMEMQKERLRTAKMLPAVLNIRKQCMMAIAELEELYMPHLNLPQGKDLALGKL